MCCPLCLQVCMVSLHVLNCDHMQLTFTSHAPLHYLGKYLIAVSHFSANVSAALWHIKRCKMFPCIFFTPLFFLYFQSSRLCTLLYIYTFIVSERLTGNLFSPLLSITCRFLLSSAFPMHINQKACKERMQSCSKMLQNVWQ